MSRPNCPVTGQPAVRLVQWVSARFLTDMWRIQFGADARPSFAGIERFGLWQSPTGLLFFDPMQEGDALFYGAFYRTTGMRRYLLAEDRGEFRLAAAHVGSGDRVLDVGCGFGTFQACIPQAVYAGLDPHLVKDLVRPGRYAETLDEHLRAGHGGYDMACAFQVLEHVARPLQLLVDMGRAVRPGGRVIVAVPHWPSAPARIPNWMTNAVPHHLTVWTSRALAAAAERVGLKVASIDTVPWSRSDAFVYWMARLSPVRCEDVRFRHRWSWHAAAIVGAALGYVASKVLTVPSSADEEGVSLMLVAERPRA